MSVEANLKRKMEEILAIPADFCISHDPCRETDLTDGERFRLQGFTHFGRRLDWLRGRAALKGLLRKWGLPEDTSVLQFPNSRVSLAHAGGLAIAGGLQNGIGFGLDYEADRKMHPEGARFFLDPGERELLGDASSRQLLRLWTVKEALFKSDLSNAGKRLSQYRLGDPASFTGIALGPENAGLRMRYAYVSLEWETGFLSVALPASFLQASA